MISPIALLNPMPAPQKAQPAEKPQGVRAFEDQIPASKANTPAKDSLKQQGAVSSEEDLPEDLAPEQDEDLSAQETTAIKEAPEGKPVVTATSALVEMTSQDLPQAPLLDADLNASAPLPALSQEVDQALPEAELDQDAPAEELSQEVLPQAAAPMIPADQPPPVQLNASLAPLTAPQDLTQDESEIPPEQPLELSLPPKAAPPQAQPEAKAPLGSAPTVQQTFEISSTADAPQAAPMLEAARESEGLRTTEVSAPMRTPQTSLPPLVRNVLERMSEIEIAAGKTRLMLRPQGLGIVELDIVGGLDGAMRVTIRAENPLVLETIKQDGASLSQLLQERGFDLSGGTPEFERYEGPQGSEGEEGQEGEGSELASETEDLNAPVLSDGRVDILT